MTALLGQAWGAPHRTPRQWIRMDLHRRLCSSLLWENGSAAVRLRSDIASFSAALSLFKARFDPADERLLVLVVDTAGWHRSAKVVVPPGVQLVFTLPDTPELMPAEHLWLPLNEGLVNRAWPSLQALIEPLDQRCVWLLQQHALVSNLTSVHWLHAA